MGTRRRWSLLLPLIIAIGVGAPGAAQRPDPHAWDHDQSVATAGAVSSPTASAGCELVEPYEDALFSALEDSDAFADFFVADDLDVGDISADEAEEIIRDGETLIADLQSLDVPASYAEAHENIIVLMQLEMDTARFYGIDTSIAPDIAAYDAALETIRDGETALAEACPDEMDAIGGYILLQPADNDTPIDPESIPE